MKDWDKEAIKDLKKYLKNSNKKYNKIIYERYYN